MANKRMFSLRIINSARFLKMPVDSQVLYFHLGMHADDDGIVEAYSVMEMLGSNEDNLKVLVAKNLVKVLNDDLVAFITDWREHNLIRADRKVDSIYKNLLLQVVPEADLIEPKPRADTGVIPRQLPTGRPLDGIGQDRLGKVNNTPSSPKGDSGDIELIEDEDSKPYKPFAKSSAVKEPRTRADVLMRELIKWAQDRRGSAFVNIPKQLNALAKMRASKLQPAEIKARWEELENNSFYADKGFDFTSVASSFDKKR